MRSKVASKNHIIEVAEQIIQKDGVEGLKVRHISKETGIAVGTIYNYFSSQEELIEEVFVISWRKTKTRLEKIAASQDIPKNKLINFFNQLNIDVRNRRGLGDYVLSKILFKTSFKDTKYDFYDDIVSLIETILSESKKYINTPKEEINAIASLTLIGFLHFNHCDSYNYETYRRILIDKFI